MALSDLRLLALGVGGGPVWASGSWGPPLLSASREMGTLVLHLFEISSADTPGEREVGLRGSPPG